MNLAAENFLIPNATFIACLLIFVIVLIVIRTMVVPPILKVLDERDERVAKTAADNKAAAENYEAADSEYQDKMRQARGDATGIRDDARAKGNEELADARKRATAKSDAELAEVSADLQKEGDKAVSAAKEDVGSYSQTLAERVLGTTFRGTSQPSTATATAAAGHTETVN